MRLRALFAALVWFNAATPAFAWSIGGYAHMAITASAKGRPADGASSGGGGSGTANITLPTMTSSNVTSRTSCVAPCAVYFDMQTTTSGLTSFPFHELLYQWDFGDPVAGAAGTCTDGAPVARDAGQGSYCTGVVTGNASLDSKNYAEGPEAAHVFETAGTYTVTVTASQGDANFNGTLDSGEYRRSTVAITVYDPEDNTNGWGTKTACVANGATPTAGANGCPTGATALINSSAMDTALTTALGTNGCGTGVPCKRILFRRGDSFTSSGTTISAAGPGLIGAYGSGAKPIINSSLAGRVIQGATGANDWRIMDLNPVSTSVDNAAFAGGGNFFNNWLVLRVDANTQMLFITSPFVPEQSATSGGWDGLFVVDSTCKGMAHLSANGDNCLYLSGVRVAAIGNHVDTDQWSEHGIRTYLQRGVISHNTVEDIASGRAAITMRSFSWAGGGGVAANTYSGLVVVSQNREPASGVGGGMGQGPTNQTTDDRCKDIIFERNYVGMGSSQNYGISGDCTSGFTVRNNIVNFGANSGGAFVFVAQDASLGLPDPTGIYIYGNSMYGSAAADYQLVTMSSTNTTGVATLDYKDNLQYTPNDNVNGDNTFYTPSMVVTQGGNTNGSGQIRTSPNFTTTPPTTALHFKPTAGSYAIGNGVSAPVWTDFVGNWQPSSRDIGAVIH